MTPKLLFDLNKPEWNIILDLLYRTDQYQYSIISRKMITMLFCKGIEDAKELFQRLGTLDKEDAMLTEVNRPSKKKVLENSFSMANEIFEIASKHLTDEDILKYIQKWIYEEKSYFLVKSLSNPITALAEIIDVIRRYYHINPETYSSKSFVDKGIIVSLIRRFLTDQLEYIEIAKLYYEIKDFYFLLQNTIFPSESHGKLGGKSAGLFLAIKVTEKLSDAHPVLKGLKIPKTWFITSDGLMNFIYYNNLDDSIEAKYKDLDEIRQEYHYIIQAFKNSHFSPEITNGLSRALDDFGDNPIIVRSSSLLEDRLGSAFAGKYKSLFLANQGNKQERMEALMDAIAEVYASTFGPDPIGYRIERGLIDFNEEMGIMIQEVVGKRYGKYYFPAFAGVAFCNNEFRWSPRIKREDGLIRMVTGLGTRAVDRLGDDYPALIAPGQPNLKVNQTFDDIVNYSQKQMDVINLETNQFETISIDEVIKEAGNDFPMINQVFSIQEEEHIKKPVGLGVETGKDKIIVTFDNLITNSDFIQKIRTILDVIKLKMNTPVDVEFACNGTNLYLLQCRPQSSGVDIHAAVIPKDIPHDRIIFSANKNISNGKIPNINFVVYVDPTGYNNIDNLQDLQAVGRAVGKLNKILPRKQFILMGPGRWGSRGDIKLGVSVTYADINNTSLLIEIAKRKGSYVPDLSFGTHFFQDLVESGIRYLPLYPDDENVIFNHKFFDKSTNFLAEMLPEFARLEHTIKVINVKEASKGHILRVLMNGEEEEAVAFIANPTTKAHYSAAASSHTEQQHTIEPWEWRKQIAELMAANLDMEKYGLKNIYMFGNTFNRSALAHSDVDILLHYDGNEKHRESLMLWVDGWNICLNYFNYNQTGYKVERMLHFHFATDDELATNKYYASLVNPKNNLSKLLKSKGT